MTVVGAAARDSRSVTPPPRRRQAETSPPPSLGTPEGCASRRDVDALTRVTIEEHGAPDLAQLHRQSLIGCVSVSALRRAWGGLGRRSQVLGWLCQGFEKYGLQDEWFINTVALLDRGVIAQSSAGAARIDALAAALVSLKMSEAEMAFDEGVRNMVLRVGMDLQSDGLQKLWARVIKAEQALCRALGYHVGLPTCIDFAGKASVPKPICLILMHFIMELGMMHLPDLTYLNSSTPSRVALAALRLALESFGTAPQAGIEYWEAQCAKFLKSDKNVDRLIEDLRLCWRNPPSGSVVVSKWSKRPVVLPQPPESCQAGGASSSASTPSPINISTPLTASLRKIAPWLSQESPAGSTTPGTASTARSKDQSSASGRSPPSDEEVWTFDNLKQTSPVVAYFGGVDVERHIAEADAEDIPNEPAIQRDVPDPHTTALSVSQQAEAEDISNEPAIQMDLPDPHTTALSASLQAEAEEISKEPRILGDLLGPQTTALSVSLQAEAEEISKEPRIQGDLLGPHTTALSASQQAEAEEIAKEARIQGDLLGPHTTALLASQQAEAEETSKEARIQGDVAEPHTTSLSRKDCLSSPFPVGTVVTLHGLAARKDLEGASGFVQSSPCAQDGRVKVRLIDGEQVRVKQQVLKFKAVGTSVSCVEVLDGEETEAAVLPLRSGHNREQGAADGSARTPLSLCPSIVQNHEDCGHAGAVASSASALSSSNSANMAVLSSSETDPLGHVSDSLSSVIEVKPRRRLRRKCSMETTRDENEKPCDLVQLQPVASNSSKTSEGENYISIPVKRQRVASSVSKTDGGCGADLRDKCAPRRGNDKQKGPTQALLPFGRAKVTATKRTATDNGIAVKGGADRKEDEGRPNPPRFKRLRSMNNVTNFSDRLELETKEPINLDEAASYALDLDKLQLLFKGSAR